MSKSEASTFSTGILHVFEDEAIDFTQGQSARAKRPRPRKADRKGVSAKKTRKKARRP